MPAATPATMPAAPAREKLNVATVPVPSTPPAAPEPASVLTVHDEKWLPIHVSDDDHVGASGRVHPFNSFKPLIRRVHIYIGIGVGGLVFLVSAFGIIKLGIKSTGVSDSDVLPGSFMHGWFGQLVWLLGIVNCMLGAYFAMDGKGITAGVIILLALTVVLALLLVHKVLDGGVTADAHGAAHDAKFGAGDSINAGIDYGHLDS
jgi:hypothetical protein